MHNTKYEFGFVREKKIIILPTSSQLLLFHYTITIVDDKLHFSSNGLDLCLSVCVCARARFSMCTFVLSLKINIFIWNHQTE